MISSKDIKNKKVLVTGAGGFIGSHLTEYLVKNGAKVTALIRYTSSGKTGWLEYLPKPLRNKIEFVFGDIRDIDICDRAVKGIDYIFHLAAQIAIPYSYIAPRDFLDVNGRGTTNLLSSARDSKVKRFLQVSTSEVYGTAQYVPIDEDHPQNTQSPYAASKVAADRMATAFHLSYGLPVTIVRPFNCYGPRQSARAVIPTIILQGLSGNKIKLGNIHTRRDMNFVGDIASGMAAACFSTNTNGLTCNLASGQHVSIEELVILISDIIGKRLMIQTETRRKRPKDSEVDLLIGNSNLAGELFGYKASTSLKSGLKKTIKFFEKNIDLYKNEDYQI